MKKLSLLALVLLLPGPLLGELPPEAGLRPAHPGKPRYTWQLRRRLIKHHIGMFRHYDPPWVDHSSWMKKERPPFGKRRLTRKTFLIN